METLNQDSATGEAKGNKKTLHFEITINASPEKIYKYMIDKQHFEQWTAVFSPGSSYKGPWEKGSKIYFVADGQDGATAGMVSRIRENIPNKFISIEHLGILANGKEIFSGPEVMKWAGGQENYTFEDKNGKTLLSIDVDSNEELIEFSEATWPKALDILKDICEA